MTNLKTLADRVEAGSGTDRELDCLIERAVGAVDARTITNGFGFGFTDRGQWACEDVKQYSASLDAAMTLIEPGWRLQHLGQRHKFDRWTAQIANDGCEERIAMEDDPSFVSRTGNTAALSVVATALAIIAWREEGSRSRISSPKGDGDE